MVKKGNTPKKHQTISLYVEGGGDSKAMRSLLREAVRTLIEKAGFGGKMPHIVASGSRNDAFDDFKTAIQQGKTALLLIDSEAPVKSEHQQGEPEDWKPWLHLKTRSNDATWEQPADCDDTDCHFMVEAMENWLLVDPDLLKTFFGSEFNANALPQNSSIEKVNKYTALKALQRASSQCQKQYKKGDISFRLLAQLDPNILRVKSPWAERFFLLLQTKLR